jgi:16S rRNA (adenine1518-N6/adenine1519-N6)-dimethyltransferase
MDRDRIKNIMQEQGILPQSRFGQNFLCDEKIIQSIVELCEIKKEDRVLEIGPGLGSLTFPLSELGCDLTCVEIDNGLAAYLSSHVTGAEIVNCDFLKYEAASCHDVVVSNIPYYVMTDIMKKLFGEFSNARKMVFMVEDEALARIDCSPATKQYGPLAILCALYGSYSFEFKVPHTAFVPQPNTTSAVISFTRCVTSDILSPEFVRFLNTCFSMRRKMLKKNLVSVASSDEITGAFGKFGISENVRAEELEPAQFAGLYRELMS